MLSAFAPNYFNSTYVKVEIFFFFSDDDENIDLQRHQFRQPYWTLKPLYFEVPSMDQPLSGPLFLGREWLYREISDHISSDLPTNKGVIITGVAGAGKTTVILQLVENSCFGRKKGNDPAQKGITITYLHAPIYKTCLYQ